MWVPLAEQEKEVTLVLQEKEVKEVPQV